MRFTRLGARRRMIQSTITISAAAHDEAQERRQQRRDQHLVQEPVPLDHVQPRRGDRRTGDAADQRMARARGDAQVPGDQVPGDRPDQAGEDDLERDHVGVDDSRRDRRGHFERDEGAEEVQHRRQDYRHRGESARVETLVAIEFAVSWKPFVKSKKSATATTVTSISSTVDPRYAFLSTMLPITFAASSQASIASSSASWMSFHLMIVCDVVLSKSSADRLAGTIVALVLDLLHLDDVLRRVAQRLQLGERTRQKLRGGDEELALANGLRRRRLDLVDAEQLGGLVDVVDDVVDRGREPVDVLAVERRDVLRVQELDDLARDAVALVLELLDLRASRTSLSDCSRSGCCASRATSSTFSPARAKRS